jgi:hypothetical protein
MLGGRYLSLSLLIFMSLAMAPAVDAVYKVRTTMCHHVAITKPSLIYYTLTSISIEIFLYLQDHQHIIDDREKKAKSMKFKIDKIKQWIANHHSDKVPMKDQDLKDHMARLEGYEKKYADLTRELGHEVGIQFGYNMNDR